MRIAMFVIAIFLGSVGFLNANWGGFNYGSVATGEFRPVGTNQIEIQNENLKISLHQGRAVVKVSYVMKNTGDAIEIKAGFPCLTDDGPTIPRPCVPIEVYKEISNYCIVADGVTLAYQESKPEEVNWLNLPPNPDDNENLGEDGKPVDNGRVLKVIWLFSELKFKPLETHNIIITYVSDYLVDGGVGGDESSGGETDILEPRYFRYLLSTGNVWKGTIQKGNIEIRAVSVDADRLSLKPKGRFIRNGDIFSWKFKNLKPGTLDNIEVCLNDGFSSFLPISEVKKKKPIGYFFYEKPDRYYREFYDCDAFSSSNRSVSYLAKNLVDGDLDTCWVAGGQNDGIGESVTFVFDEPRKITEIGITSGYVKSEKLYLANNRPCTIQLTFDDQDPVLKVLRDEFISCDNEDWSYQWFALDPDMSPVQKVVLKILSVYKGTKYNDTCISEVKFREKLAKDPFPEHP